jgi:hypothetical protein
MVFRVLHFTLPRVITLSLSGRPFTVRLRTRWTVSSPERQCIHTYCTALYGGDGHGHGGAVASPPSLRVTVTVASVVKRLA